ncbi:MAG: type II 3-dehydroquinate dehydratase [Streptosporangiales bacterium]|nr:type II 3-dehydroquinate dehydratase [Streptosporangiales bacterium]
MSRRVLVLNGPNLGRLGSREPEKYGTQDYAALVEFCHKAGREAGLEVEVRQSDHEGELVGWLHEAADEGLPVVLNPAAFTHYSIALRDAVAQRTAPLIEVHLTNVAARESFRQVDVITAVATGVIAGLGFEGYRAALLAIARL